MFANHKLAADAAARELLEAQARIRAQQDLARAEAEATHRALMVAREKAANEAKSEFMSLMCHEVRTPLNGCLASAEMLLETSLQEDQRELAQTIRVSGSILLSTVSNFLDYFKMEAGKKLDIVRTEVNLGNMVNDVSKRRVRESTTQSTTQMTSGGVKRLGCIYLLSYSIVYLPNSSLQMSRPLMLNSYLL